MEMSEQQQQPGNMNTSFSENIPTWVQEINTLVLHHDESEFVEYTPKLGLKFDSETAAYDFYNNYGRRNGFGIRREYKNTSKVDGLLTSRRFTCCKEGDRPPDKRDSQTKEPRALTRTGCSKSAGRKKQ